MRIERCLFAQLLTFSGFLVQAVRFSALRRCPERIRTTTSAAQKPYRIFKFLATLALLPGLPTNPPPTLHFCHLQIAAFGQRPRLEKTARPEPFIQPEPWHSSSFCVLYSLCWTASVSRLVECRLPHFDARHSCRTRVTRMRLVDHLNVLGLREWIGLPGLRIDQVMGQIDSGAPKTSAMHPAISKTFEPRRQTWVCVSMPTCGSLKKAAQTNYVRRRLN